MTLRRLEQPGNNLVEIFLVLEYIPAYFSKWKRELTADFRKFSSMGVKERMLNGEQRSSFCATLLENGPEKHGLSDLVWAAATIYGAAYETLNHMEQILRWSINCDPELYGADAEEFYPERHLNPNGTLKDEKGDGHFTFGFGRR
ncbi:hypothetical protein K435DRAFT_810818 [Dendrothele bispora CBS 962.96]|uniref:Uncharacterized protein n=1 Tax=Dendrothele bispora (strain CBS 962.96) TaxID=1314807 RepID=A0A4S8KTY0_DENBC|nr:hypothetical protein K435DRAFT_810818 [Dendrothele bispora CBS 962.96]